jgi:hypothetical protein
MPSGDKTFSQSTISTTAELDPRWVSAYWKYVELFLREVFQKSEREARDSIARLQGRMESFSDSAALLLYHDSPLQTAAILSGASERALTDQELLAYDELWANAPDRPSQEQILQVHRTMRAS